MLAETGNQAAEESRRFRRDSLRLRGFDYSSDGAYFVTSCIQERRSLLGRVVTSTVVLTEAGRIVQETWLKLPELYPGVVSVDQVVMPNHFHGIIMLTGSSSSLSKQQKPGLPQVMRGFKSISARRINKARGKMGTPVWQRSYYDHVIRDENDMLRIREYIRDNPLKWHLDRENPRRSGINDFYQWLDRYRVTAP